MENKNIQLQELELIDKLLEAVNSKEEFEWLLAEKARLVNVVLLMKGGTQKW